MKKYKHIYSAPLSKGNTVHLGFSSKPKKEDIESIRKWLEIFQENLIKQEPDNNAEEHF